MSSKVEVSNRVENIFAHAVALDQSARLRNTVYGWKNQVLILNSDNTVLLRFPMRPAEGMFPAPVSFRANDYDSRSFRIEGNQIIFVRSAGGWTREKKCGTPEATPEQIVAVWRKYKPLTDVVVALPETISGLLEEALSHVEFHAGTDGVIHIVQRNVYSGSVIDVTPSAEGAGLGLCKVSAPVPFGPIGMRTGDLLALFAFNPVVHLGFPASADIQYIWAEGRNPAAPFSGPIAGCLYDELGAVTETARGK